MRIENDWTFEAIKKLVLYEDNHLLAMEKPAGILTQADRTGDICLMDLARRYLAKKYAKTGEVYLGMVQRLDRPVGGVIVFARTSKAARRLSEQFRSHETKKIYRAVVEGRPEPPEGELTHWLLKSGMIMKIVAPKTPASQEARLIYRTLENRGDTSLVEVKLITGKRHQIRAQLAKIGCSIVGDIKYGARAGRGEPRRPEDVVTGIMLFASCLTFRHPTTGAQITVEARTPKGFLTADGR
jgi:23S rRNA pseudouridine1911/1915/1917 synthase